MSLAPSVTSILCSIGARRRIVGVTKWCKDVADVDGLPQVGDCWSGDPAEIEALAPTLVIGSVPFKAETVGRLLERPITFLAQSPRSLADIYADIRLLGAITGRQSAANRLVARMEQTFAAIRRRAARVKRRPRVYCEAWPNPRISSPPWVAELVEMAGGKMVVPAGQRVTDAEVKKANPEVMVIAWTATGARPRPQQTLKNRAWKNVAAIRDARVHVVRDELLNTPGPPLLQGVQILFRLLHRR